MTRKIVFFSFAGGIVVPWYRGQNQSESLHCIVSSDPPDLDLVPLALFASLSMKMMETPLTQSHVPLSLCVVEKTTGCWTIILGSWFSTAHAIVLCYYMVAMLFLVSTFGCWFGTAYNLVFCDMFWYAREHICMVASAVVQQEQRLLSFSRLWERKHRGHKGTN